MSEKGSEKVPFWIIVKCSSEKGIFYPAGGGFLEFSG